MLQSTIFASLMLTTIAHCGVLSERASCSIIGSVTHTFYGYPDNSPPGAKIAYNCGRGYTAGGTGTLQDPLTMATAPGEFNQCEVIYVPYLQKYVRFEDTCAQCTTDWKSGKYHIDIWTGSSTVNGGNDQINCENSLTPNAHSMIRNPRSSETVDSTALYDPSTGGCRRSHTYDTFKVSDYC